MNSIRQFKAEIFQGLAHPKRIAIVEVLEAGEISAGKLMEQLGLEQANVSQHLAVLRARKVVVSRKVGNQVFYSLRDPVLGEILGLLRRYFYLQLSDTINLMKEEVGQTEKAGHANAAMAPNTVE
jgi:DNA-binding transcriptional ArsR family regulator